MTWALPSVDCRTGTVGRSPVIHKPQSSRLQKWARKHTSAEAIAKRQAKRQEEERERLRWLLIRVAVYERDKGLCRNCGRAVKLNSINPFNVAHIHHIVYRSANGTDDLSNLVLLCGESHDKEHRHVIDITGTSDDLHIARDLIHG